MGGVQIDTESHAIDTAGKIIPGLYAAGEVQGHPRFKPFWRKFR